MPDYGCIHADVLGRRSFGGLKQIIDDRGRSWLYAELPQQTPELLANLGTSEYAYAGWMLQRRAPVFQQLKEPLPGMFGSWNKSQERLWHAIHELQVSGPTELAAALAKIDVHVEQPEEMATAPMDTGTRETQPNADYRKKAPHSEASPFLQYDVIARCQALSESGWERYRSGELSMNGRNYAEDIISGAEFARNSVAALPKEHATKETLIVALQCAMDAYEQEYEDIEGFGVGTIRDVLNLVEGK